MDKILAKEYRKAPWRIKREVILMRDNYVCQCCGRAEKDGVVLQVHHLIYLPHCKPWEYPDYAFITLCSGCHAAEHGHRLPSSGWIYDNEYDAGYTGAEQCQLCGTDLRYVHLLHHPNWGNIMVGLECEAKLLQGDNSAMERVKERERYAEKLKRFVNSPMWKQKKNGYFYKKDGLVVRIWDNVKYFSITYQYEDDTQFEKIKQTFKTLVEAKYYAFNEFYAPIVHEYRSYPKDEFLECKQPDNPSDRKNLIKNICIQTISREKEFILPVYDRIKSHIVKFLVVRKNQLNLSFMYDVYASTKSKNDDKVYDFYIRFVFGETLTEQEVALIKEKNIQYIIVDCSSLMSNDKISMDIIHNFLYNNESYPARWINSPIYENYL